MKKKSARRKSHTRRSRSENQPSSGAASPGEAFDPKAIPQERETFRGPPRAAPAPGVPVTHEEYERLKQRAKTVRKRSSEHVQEDPSEKK
jgi:hypothetical protein